MLAWAVMANLMASCSFTLLTYVLIAVGAFLALLRVAFVILLHPFQALKKTPRDGKQGREGGRDCIDCSPIYPQWSVCKKNAVLYMYKPAVGICRLFPRSSTGQVFGCLQYTKYSKRSRTGRWEGQGRD